MKAMIKDGVIHSPYPDVHVPSCSLFALLEERMLRSGDKAALLYRDRAVSHVELLQRLRSCAAGLQALGLGRGDRVYTRFCSSSVDGPDRLVRRDFHRRHGHHRRRLHAGIKSLDITHLLTDSGTSDRLIPLLPELNLKGTLSVDELPGFTCVSSPQWANGKCFRDNWNSATCEDDVAMIAYSSGTSGLPKNIEIPQRCLLYCLIAAEVTQPLTSDDICVTGANICTYIGFSLYLKGLYLGATYLMMEQRERIHGLVDAVARHKVTWFMSPPLRALGYARQVQQSGRGPPPSLRSILLAGSPLSAAVAREVGATLQPDEMRNAYGTTETGGIITIPPQGECCFDNVGFPLPGIRVKVIDAKSGAVLGPMEEGDVGYYDEDGRLYLIGRAKFTLDCYGKKVSPCELEDCLIGTPGLVLKPCCKNRGEELAEQIKVHVAARLSPWKHLYGGVYFADAIPRTETGKILRRDLPELLLSLPRIDRPGATP
ncbi:hypothetical protein MTO96_004382 [Rhipicephalus appendiculatus]